MSITLEYNAWNGETESIPEIELGGLTTAPSPRKPFDLRVARDIIFRSGHTGYKGDSEYQETTDMVLEGLWSALAWFRRHDVSALELERMVKNYPAKPRTYHQTVLDAVRSQMSPEVYSDPLSLG